MKKYINILMVAILVFGLTACGKKKSDKDKYDNIYCEKSSANIKETIELKTKKPEEIKFVKETTYSNKEEYEKVCNSKNSDTTQTAYSGVKMSYNCNEDNNSIEDIKIYIVADAKKSFDLDYIKNNGELDDKKFIEEYEIDGYKCEYK